MSNTKDGMGRERQRQLGMLPSLPIVMKAGEQFGTVRRMVNRASSKGRCDSAEEALSLLEDAIEEGDESPLWWPLGNEWTRSKKGSYYRKMDGATISVKTGQIGVLACRRHGRHVGPRRPSYVVQDSRRGLQSSGPVRSRQQRNAVWQFYGLLTNS